MTSVSGSLDSSSSHEPLISFEQSARLWHTRQSGLPTLKMNWWREEATQSRISPSSSDVKLILYRYVTQAWKDSNNIIEELSPKPVSK